ncbi:polysaccharide export protein EpsE [Duganella qianjiadongensis]|uniref:Polysaccharide export protein EpsE n=1 Tax=Duganella qianjiadongensis TaxID=2692176 RepID=A0ABW9VQ19_9BURK|nr:polysaccharide export protein EpsE [Duganella qianjiadongensis]MYM41669.1 polysaccharide export protein EpsE [Duganella qianjiadongensis]
MKQLTKWLALLAVLLMFSNAQAADAVLGPGDILKISVYGNPDLATETRVSDAGTITFPLLGPVEIGGLTATSAEKKLGGLLETGGFLRKAQVNILITQIQNQQISVLGQVNRPGRYPIEGRRSILDMLAMAGGIAADGGDTVSLIRKRNGTTTKEVVDIIGMVRTGELEKDFELAANDVLYVERAPRFYIYGEVQRPGPVRLERSMTVLQALSAGGGLTPRGTERGMVIKRRDIKGKQQVLDAKQDDLVQPDDVVYVKESLF